jgi:nitronate monooxygenase
MIWNTMEKSPETGAAAMAAGLSSLARDSGLRPLRLGGKTLVPIVQGGMGVGVSASGLAGTVAGCGAVGTISSVDLRRHHPDLMEQTGNLVGKPEARERIDAANLVALDREITRARALAGGRGLIAVNVMKAVSAYEAYVRQSLASGVDAIVVGAGLPLDLPDIARDHSKALLIPILSDARGVQLVVRKWEKKGRLPSAIVIEHPRLAGGHLGAAKVADVNDPRFEFDVVIPQSLAFFKSAGIEGEIPLIAAGGIRARADILRLQSLGAAAVQLGTAIAVTTQYEA